MQKNSTYDTYDPGILPAMETMKEEESKALNELLLDFSLTPDLICLPLKVFEFDYGLVWQRAIADNRGYRTIHLEITNNHLTKASFDRCGFVSSFDSFEVGVHFPYLREVYIFDDCAFNKKNNSIEKLKEYSPRLEKLLITDVRMDETRNL